MEVEESSILLKESNAYLKIGLAYDGLPLLLHITRLDSIEDLVLSKIGVDSIEKLPEQIKVSLEHLQKAISDRSCKMGIVDTKDLGSKASHYYKSSQGVGSLIVQTSLSLIMKDNSNSSLNERGEDYEWHVQYKNTT